MSGVDPAGGTAMSKANVAFVQSLYAAFGRGDIKTIIAGLSPDIHWHSGGREQDYPGFGPRKGHKQVEDFFKIVADNNDFQHFTPREFHAVDDKVFVLGEYAMTLKKSGKPYESDWCHIFTIRDGKVTSFREFLDTAKAAEAYRG
jgi:ketosteroid isomerase-like protein